MSNFQRRRSKVWWGNSPPNIGSPLPDRFIQEHGAREGIPELEEWEPQLPRWAGGEDGNEEEQGAVGRDETPPLARHSSPNSHKSQDSGFSDSDSSPPLQQQPQPRANTPQNSQNIEIKTPCHPLRETPARSAIKTPRDLHNYIEAHCEIGHVPYETVTQQSTPGDPIKVIMTPYKRILNRNINTQDDNNNNNSDKRGEKSIIRKNLLERFNIFYQDSETTSSKYKDDTAPKSRITVNNPPTDFGGSSHYAGCFGTVDYFERNRLNRSFHSTCRTQRMEEQTLREEYTTHSLGYIELQMNEEKDFRSENHQIKLFSNRHIPDTLQFKKSLLKNKSKTHHKASKIRQCRSGIFNFMPKKNEPIKTIYDITKDSERIPTLGLPCGSSLEWMRGNQIASPTEECYKDEGEAISNMEREHLKGILKTPGSVRKITPPIQFRDLCDRKELNGGLNNVLSRESSCEELWFSEQDLSGLCTSTPKSFASNQQLKHSSLKPTNLLHNFNNTSIESHDNCTESDECLTPLEQICRGREAPMQQWLCALAGATESEVGTLLQSKPLGRREDATISSTSHTITGNIRKTHTHALLITHTLTNLLDELKTDGLKAAGMRNNQIKCTVDNMKEFILAHSATLKTCPPGESPERWGRLSATLDQNVEQVVEIAEDIKLEMSEMNPDVEVLRRQVKALYKIFSDTARGALIQQMQTLVGLLEEPPSDKVLKGTLTSLGQLGRCSTGDDRLCEVPMVQCGVPRALLQLIIQSNKSSVKALSLRALATICTNSEAVQQFEQAGGLEIICEILAERNIPEPQTKEAVTVLAQVTAPWLSGHYFLPSLHAHLGSIIENLTCILSETSCCQLLLLCTAGLVNVVRSMRGEGNGARGTIAALRDYKTLHKLLDAVKRKGPNASVFLQEQTATLLDLVTCCAGGRVLVCGCPAACVALLCFLRPTPPTTPQPAASLPLRQAELRLLTHTAETLARLCTIPEVCERVIQLEGPSRLIRVILSAPPRAPLLPLLKTLRCLYHAAPTCLPPHLTPFLETMIHLPLMDAVSHYQQQLDKESYV